MILVFPPFILDLNLNGTQIIKSWKKNRFAQRLFDMRSYFEFVEDESIEAIEVHFRTQGSGEWDELREVTVDLKEREGHLFTDEINKETGAFYESLTEKDSPNRKVTVVDNNRMVIESTLPYANIPFAGVNKTITKKQANWMNFNLHMGVKEGDTLIVPKRDPFPDIETTTLGRGLKDRAISFIRDRWTRYFGYAIRGRFPNAD